MSAKAKGRDPVKARASANGASAGDKPAPARPTMKMPERLALNFDSVNADEIFEYLDPNGDATFKRNFLNRVIVGGLKQYHFLLIGQLGAEVTRQLVASLPRGKKKRR